MACRFRLLALHLAVILAAGCGPTLGETGGGGDPAIRDLKAIDELEQAVAADPDGPVGDRAALKLGYLLLRRQRPADALPLLRRGTAVDSVADYARLLLVRAVVDGELAAADDEAAEVAAGLRRPGVRGTLREEAALFLTRLRFRQRRWREAGAAGREFLASCEQGLRCDQARWLVAQAELEAGEHAAAHAALEAIWYGTPESPWASEARDRLRDLERQQGLTPRRLSPASHHQLIETLQSAGRHRGALQEIAGLLAAHPRYPGADGVLYLKAVSHHALRQNRACVATVEQLWREHPGSSWLPDAGIYAIKALRRSDETAAIRRWAQRITDRHPGHEKAFAALYELGGHLGNAVAAEDGIQVLKRLVEEGGGHPNVTDALWKIVWFERRRGRTPEAVAALERLVAEHPESGYRGPALYWLARFVAEADRRRAVELYQTCWRELPSSYYGQRSRTHLVGLGVEPQPPPSPGLFPAVDRLDDPAAGPDSRAYRLAVELKSLGLYEFAAAELATLAESSGDRGLWLALAELHRLDGRAREAERLLRRHFEAFLAAGPGDPAVPEDFWRLAYPLGYGPEIEAAVAEHPSIAGLDVYLVAALIKSESRFQWDAVSPVGALGLMQLMPETAKEEAARLGLAPPSRAELLEPRLNIRLGVSHLARRFEGFGGERLPAVASYNAGPAAVRGWWSRRPLGQPQDEFIENIPYYETRLYVKRILADDESYRSIYGPGRRRAVAGGAAAEPLVPEEGFEPTRP